MNISDQTGHDFIINNTPKRIVSLVPSLTELLFDLELENEIIGITKFCTRPETGVKNKLSIGGTKTPRVDIIKVLKPDLIIAAKEENLEAHILELRDENIPCYVSNIKNIQDAYSLIKSFGALFDKPQIADKLLDDIIFEQSLDFTRKDRSALYLIWKDPYMAAAGDTFINEMMAWGGFNNVLADRSRYPNLNIDEMVSLDPDVVLLSSEPYPFKKKHIESLRSILPKAQIKLVDGQSFSWYGSRLRHAFQDIRVLIKSIN